MKGSGRRIKLDNNVSDRRIRSDRIGSGRRIKSDNNVSDRRMRSDMNGSGRRIRSTVMCQVGE